MTFSPPRLRGLLLGSLCLAILVGTTGLAIARLSSEAISPWTLLWVILPLLGLPLALMVGYRLYGLLNSHYRIDRDAFILRWGLAFEQIPLADLARPQTAAQLSTTLRRPAGFWWPGCMVGRRVIEGLGPVEFFATTGLDRLVLLRSGERTLAISPADVDAFLQAFTDALRLGSLHPVPSRSQRPDFLFGRVWASLPARILIPTGLALPLLLLAYLAVRAPALPPAGVAFGFLPTGQPAALAPAGRLLLLPLIAGLCWMADLAVGVWLFRREQDRPLAYALWAVSILTGVLLWGAALILVGTGRAEGAVLEHARGIAWFAAARGSG
jgi:hypothetical protein